MGNLLIRKNHMLLFILFLALGMRLVVVNQSLWLDEAIGALAVRDFSYFGILNDFLRSDNHPPLYYIVLKMWSGIFGYSELSLRIPSILFGLGTIYFSYLIAGEISKNVVLKIRALSISLPELAALFIANHFPIVVNFP